MYSIDNLFSLFVDLGHLSKISIKRGLQITIYGYI